MHATPNRTRSHDCVQSRAAFAASLTTFTETRSDIGKYNDFARPVKHVVRTTTTASTVIIVWNAIPVLRAAVRSGQYRRFDTYATRGTYLRINTCRPDGHRGIGIHVFFFLNAFVRLAFRPKNIRKISTTLGIYVVLLCVKHEPKSNVRYYNILVYTTRGTNQPFYEWGCRQRRFKTSEFGTGELTN